MKLRIQGNSLRLRLAAAEVQQLAQSGQVADAIAFGPGPEQTLHYVLARREAVAAISVDFTGNTLMVYLPDSVVMAWTGNPETSLSGFVDNGTEKGLKVLVEQDQGCFHRGEDGGPA